MGNGFAPKCKKCGYEFHALYGVGMFFPYEYRKQSEKSSDRSGSLRTPPADSGSYRTLVQVS